LGIDAVSRPAQDRSVAQTAIAPADRVGDGDGARTGTKAGAIGACVFRGDREHGFHRIVSNDFRGS